MSWGWGIFVFGLIWWTVLFAVLPWGIHVPEKTEPGHAPSAPENPRLVLKAIITTAISAVIWVIIYYIIDNGLIQIRPPQP
jgi:predicted secreted protein